jgi:hypothetical protein
MENLSPTRRETLNFPPSLVGKGVRGLGFSSAFPHDLNCQVDLSSRTKIFTVIAFAERLVGAAAIPALAIASLRSQ